jgi:hypothetical protein
LKKVPGSDIWWIRFKVDGVEHREKVGRRGDAIKLYGLRNGETHSFCYCLAALDDLSAAGYG